MNLLRYAHPDHRQTVKRRSFCLCMKPSAFTGCTVGGKSVQAPDTEKIVGQIRLCLSVKENRGMRKAMYKAVCMNAAGLTF